MGATKSIQGIVILNQDGEVVEVLDDSGTDRLATIAKVLNASAVQINPATQETLVSLEGKDFATQTTLSTLATSANQTNGQQVAIIRSGNKGTSSANIITSNPIDANTEALHVDGSNVTQPISVVSLPLPAGAATEATLASILVDTGQIESLLTAIDADTSNLDVALSTRATEATLVAVDAVLDNIYVRQNDRTQKTQITDGTNDVAIFDDGGTYRLRVDAKLGTGDEVAGRIKITDGTDVADVYTWGEDASAPKGLGVFGRDDSDFARMLLTDTDGTLKVATRPQGAPATATAVIYPADTPLELNNASSPDDTDASVIANGVNFYLQSIIGGAAGDPSEDGSFAEVYWVEGSPETEHLIARIYLLGQTLQFNFPDTNIARDGTQMTGNGTNTFIRIRRTRLSNALQGVDCVVFGYTV